MNVVWIAPWRRVCGIADYSRRLWPVVRAAVGEAGGRASIVSLDDHASEESLMLTLAGLSPDLIHFQHEHGIWRGRLPLLSSRFPRFVQRLRDELGHARLVATAHTVIQPDWRLMTVGTGLRPPLMAAANVLVLERLKQLMGEVNWRGLNGVAVHCPFQVAALEAAGVPLVEVIPHYVPAVAPDDGAPALTSERPPTVLVFGFFSPGKGQDVVIEAFHEVPPPARLVLAGGARRGAHQNYLELCLKRARQLGVADRTHVTGYVPAADIRSYYRNADLVVAPFRESSGSGSLAWALSCGAPVLASDLVANREVAGREPGVLAFFRAEDAPDCAARIRTLLADDGRRRELAAASLRYAHAHSAEKMAMRHLAFYERVMSAAAPPVTGEVGRARDRQLRQMEVERV